MASFSLCGQVDNRVVHALSELQDKPEIVLGVLNKDDDVFLYTVDIKSNKY